MSWAGTGRSPSVQHVEQCARAGRSTRRPTGAEAPPGRRGRRADCRGEPGTPRPGGVLLPPPAARALGLAGQHGARARRAPDRRVAVIEELVVGTSFVADVVPDARRAVQSASGFSLTMPPWSRSSSTFAMLRRLIHCSRRRPAIHASSVASLRFSGSTLRIVQQGCEGRRCDTSRWGRSTSRTWRPRPRRAPRTRRRARANRRDGAPAMRKPDARSHAPASRPDSRNRRSPGAIRPPSASASPAGPASRSRPAGACDAAFSARGPGTG